MSRLWRPALVIISLVAAFVVDTYTFRGYPIAPLYIIPVLLAAYWYSPRVVAAIAGLALVLLLVSASFQSFPPSIEVYYTLSLVATFLVVLGLAMLISSQRQQLTQQTDVLAAARAEAERRGHQLTEMISLIAHDLRQPLTIILGQALLVQRALEAGNIQQAESSADHLVVTSRQLDAMIHELVESAQVEQGRLHLQLEPIELVGFVAHHLDRLRGVQDVSRVSVEATTPASVCADPTQLERILDNLLSNAMKYSDPNTAIRLCIEKRPDLALIAITDHGVGIAPEDLPHLFERGFRATRLEPRTTGLGLGLYITRRLVEAHGGRIWATSELGKGSTFFVALALARETCNHR